MDVENIKRLISIVDKAHTEILLAERCHDGRKRDKQIREAKTRAWEMVLRVEPEIRELCNLDDNHGMDDLFAWGFLERDLAKVYEKLSELLNT